MPNLYDRIESLPPGRTTRSELEPQQKDKNYVLKVQPGPAFLDIPHKPYLTRELPKKKVTGYVLREEHKPSGFSQEADEKSIPRRSQLQIPNLKKSEDKPRLHRLTEIILDSIESGEDLDKYDESHVDVAMKIKSALSDEIRGSILGQESPESWRHDVYTAERLASVLGDYQSAMESQDKKLPVDVLNTTSPVPDHDIVTPDNNQHYFDVPEDYNISRNTCNSSPMKVTITPLATHSPINVGMVDNPTFDNTNPADVIKSPIIIHDREDTSFNKKLYKRTKPKPVDNEGQNLVSDTGMYIHEKVIKHEAIKTNGHYSKFLLPNSKEINENDVFDSQSHQKSHNLSSKADKTSKHDNVFVADYTAKNKVEDTIHSDVKFETRANASPSKSIKGRRKSDQEEYEKKIKPRQGKGDEGNNGKSKQLHDSKKIEDKISDVEEGGVEDNDYKDQKTGKYAAEGAIQQSQRPDDYSQHLNNAKENEDALGKALDYLDYVKKLKNSLHDTDSETMENRYEPENANYSPVDPKLNPNVQISKASHRNSVKSPISSVNITMFGSKAAAHYVEAVDKKYIINPTINYPPHAIQDQVHEQEIKLPERLHNGKF